MMTPNSPIAVQVALSALESLSDDESLSFSPRGVIRCNRDGAAGRRSDAKQTRTSRRREKTETRKRVLEEVLSNDDLLANILEFDGSLAYYHRNYDVIVGYEQYLPYDWSGRYYKPSQHYCPLLGMKLSDAIKRRRGTKTNLLVCKKWKSMVMGKSGWSQWKSRSEERVQRDICNAKKTAQDESLSWTARIVAMAIANDVSELKLCFANSNDESRGIGAAIAEQQLGKSSHPVPMKHSFYRGGEVQNEKQLKRAFLISTAFSASLYGSTESIVYLESLLRSPLWPEKFREGGDDSFLSSLVQHACANPTLDCITESIEAILPPGKFSHSPTSDNLLHHCDSHGNGNHLHFAAGRGHTRLAHVLIVGGLSPNMRPRGATTKIQDARGRWIKECPHSEHWASVRGHHATCELIHSYAVLRGINNGVKRGRVKRMYKTCREYGYIKADDGSKMVPINKKDFQKDECPFEDGDYVEFTVDNSNRGISAFCITLLKRASESDH